MIRKIVSFHMPRWLSPASTLDGNCRGPCARHEETIAVDLDADRPRRSRPNRITILPDVGPIQSRLEDIETWPPDGIAFTVAATDVQSNRLETLILGMPADRSWAAVLDYHITRTRPTEAAAWTALQRIWDDAGVRLGAVDAGYLPAAVRALASRDRRCLPIRGMAGVRPPISPPSGSGWCFTSGSDGVKRAVLAAVDSGWLRLPAAVWCTRAWLHSLTAEHETVVERSGRRVTVWKQHYRRNEALDCATYALAVAELVPRPRRRRPRLVRV